MMSDVKVFLNRRNKATSDESYDISDIPEPLIKAIYDYINDKIAALINGAPEALDTLGEIANAMKENANVVEALNLAIETKANKSDLSNYVLNDDLRQITADEVGADKKGSADTALVSAQSYTNAKIAELVNGAPESLDTLKELAEAYQTNHNVIETLDAAITNKADKTQLENYATKTELNAKAEKNAVVSGIKGETETAYRTGDVDITKENIGVCKNIGVFAGTGYGTVGSATEKIAEWCYRSEALTTVARCIVPVTVANSLATPTDDDDNIVIPDNDVLTVLYINPLGGYHAADGTVANGLYMLTSVSYGKEFIRFPLYSVSRADDGLHPEREGYTLNADGTYSVNQ